MPGGKLQGRTCAKGLQKRQNIFQLQQISAVQIRHMGPACTEAVPAMWQTFSPGKKTKEGNCVAMYGYYLRLFRASVITIYNALLSDATAHN